MYNENLWGKLLKVQEKSYRIGTEPKFTRDRQKIRMHERCHNAIHVAKLQLLTATCVFPKKLSKWVRPARSACCSGSSLRKTWQTKSKHNESVLQKMKNLLKEIAHEDLMTSSAPVLIHQMVSFLASKEFHCIFFFVDDHKGCTFAYHR